MVPEIHRTPQHFGHLSMYGFQQNQQKFWKMTLFRVHIYFGFGHSNGTRFLAQWQIYCQCPRCCETGSPECMIITSCHVMPWGNLSENVGTETAIGIFTHPKSIASYPKSIANPLVLVFLVKDEEIVMYGQCMNMWRFP